MLSVYAVINTNITQYSVNIESTCPQCPMELKPGYQVAGKVHWSPWIPMMYSISHLIFISFQSVWLGWLLLGSPLSISKKKKTHKIHVSERKWINKSWVVYIWLGLEDKSKKRNWNIHERRENMSPESRCSL